MPTNLPASYSGIVLNQNASPTAYTWDSSFVYQTFYLPTDYARGGTAIPDLSGFQILATVDADDITTVTLQYTMDVYIFGSGWQNLTAGVVTGAHASGVIWFDVIFPASVPVTEDQLELPSLFRIGVTGNQEGIGTLWYTTPNPLSQHTVFPAGLSPADQLLARYPQAYQADSLTPLIALGQTALNFRLLALVADSGTDFLGNEYRSYVTQAAPANVSTTDGAVPVLGSGQNSAWRSPPLPSRFAVASMYFDMRPTPAGVTYGLTNLAHDPGFEWDVLGAAPAWWSSLVSSGTLSTFLVQNSWAADGLQSLRITGTSMTISSIMGSALLFVGETATTFSGPSLIMPTVVNPGVLVGAGFVEAVGAPITIQAGVPYTLQATCNNLNGSPYLAINWLDSSAAFISQALVTGIGATGLQQLTVLDQVAPPNAAQAVLILGNLALASTVDAYWDSIMFTQTSDQPPYADGDSVSWGWTGNKGNSASNEIIEPSVSAENAQVVDGINVDPSTPNMAFNVYYSQDDAGTGPTMDEGDWEQKLWTRVPQVYLCTHTQTYAFPEPIIAKYIKVEFTNLQSQNYDPGNFVLPISYKRFPTWVANFFVVQMDIAPFTASQVNVQYDALDFAYNYFLDDLDSAPAFPVVPPANAVAQLTNYFNADNNQFQVDATTLAQINLALNIYVSPAASVPSSGSLVSNLAASIVNAPKANPTSEGQVIPAVDYSVVSTLNRESVVFEQSLPVMYFFVTCRHTYQELSAPLQYNRAYFAGVNSISFIRNNYKVAADTDMYIETGADPLNIQRSDFVTGTSGYWYTYPN